MWDLWWTEWQWDRFSSERFGFIQLAIIPPMLHAYPSEGLLQQAHLRPRYHGTYCVCGYVNDQSSRCFARKQLPQPTLLLFRSNTHCRKIYIFELLASFVVTEWGSLLGICCSPGGNLVRYFPCAKLHCRPREVNKMLFHRRRTKTGRIHFKSGGKTSQLAAD